MIAVICQQYPTEESEKEEFLDKRSITPIILDIKSFTELIPLNWWKVGTRMLDFSDLLSICEIIKGLRNNVIGL